jgi:hypothetical protein
MIVIVSTANDSAISSVIKSLKNRGREDVLWLDLETAFQEVTLESRADSQGVSWSIRSKQHPHLVVTPDNITAVYWRRPVSYLGSPFMGIPTSQNLDALEVFWSIRWHLEALPQHLFPLGHPWMFARCENKHRQMELAQQLGFQIPNTLHSNAPQLLSAFAREQETVAIKALRMPAVSANGDVMRARHISCRAFPGKALADRLDTTERCQLYCQEAIQRRADLRITVLPQQTICTEIDITPLEGNKLDWREHSKELPHRIIPIDPAFDAQLRQYLAAMELTAGYFDFAVPFSGPPIFFECNTNAQWLWIEQVTGFSFGDAIAQELCR